MMRPFSFLLEREHEREKEWKMEMRWINYVFTYSLWYAIWIILHDNSCNVHCTMSKCSCPYTERTLYIIITHSLVKFLLIITTIFVATTTTTPKEYKTSTIAASHCNCRRPISNNLQHTSYTKVLISYYLIRVFFLVLSWNYMVM